MWCLLWYLFVLIVEEFVGFGRVEFVEYVE